MSYEKFKDVVFSTEPLNMVYHLYKSGLCINATVISVVPYYDSGITVDFVGGNFHVWSKNKITECLKPANLITDCEICFNVNNEYDEHIGYLFIPK
ncbi:hypothetical protein MHH81_20650 [Psychrobacillus sp. FSL H8-0484]|uniref:hypothetical protein n=1 Tax=Psychrobacillus sp. FSL H8-0484 TaxID=2921390 RepID=UPI0030FC20EF